MSDASTDRATAVLTAVDHLTEIAQGWDGLAGEIFTNMQCVEVNALAAVFRAAGAEETAGRIIELHAEGDYEEDDQHHTLYLELRADS